MLDALNHMMNQSFFYPIVGLFLLILTLFLIRRAIRKKLRTSAVSNEEEFTQLLGDAGYAYDSAQGIFYSKINAWQRKYGYCRLYDEAAVISGMILDSEPIRFEYKGKRWLIQFWKGQYYLNTGGEIGIYNTSEPDLEIPGFFNGTFYRSIDASDRLDMEFTLLRNGTKLFQRKARHWWLTGFLPGTFSEPQELTMKVRIAFRDPDMSQSFTRALRRIGYHDYEIKTFGATVEFLFGKPRSTQPATRTEETDWLIQRNNERVCARFTEITGPYDNWNDKLSAIRREEPFLYDSLLKIGKTRQIFKAFERLKQFL